MKKNIKKIAVYLRLSLEKRGRADGDESLDNHKQILSEYAERQGWEILEFYEEVLSGSTRDMKKRPELERLMGNLGKFEAILVMELSRIARNGLISQTVKELCSAYEVFICTPGRTYDMNSDEDRLLYDMETSFTNMEARKIGRRSKTNKVELARKGYHVSGSKPFGLRRNENTKKLEAYEPEAKIVKYIYKLYLQGLGVRLIADQLNREGLKPARGKKFSDVSIKRILKNDVYKGTVTLTDRKKVMEDGQEVYKVMEVIKVPEAHAPLIDPETWERVQVIMQGRAERYKARERTGAVNSSLRGLIFCGICGRKQSFKRERNGNISISPCQFRSKETGLKCHNSGILAHKLEASVTETIKKYRERVREELEKLQDNDTEDIQEEKREQLRHIDSELQGIQRKKRSLLEYALEELFTPEEIREKQEALDSQETALTARQKRLQAQLRELDFSDAIKERELILEYLEGFEHASLEEQNKVLRRIIKKIHFTRDIPPDIRSLPTSQRQDFPCTIEIEYI